MNTYPASCRAAGERCTFRAGKPRLEGSLGQALPRPCRWTGRGREQGGENMTAENVRRLWEILLKIRDEEKGEHADYEVIVNERKDVQAG